MGQNQDSRPITSASAKEHKPVDLAQADSSLSLPLNALYIALYFMDHPPVPKRFHWTYYLHKGIEGGTKYQIRNLGGGWVPDHDLIGDILKSNFLCVLVQIATVPEYWYRAVDQIMASYDTSLNAIPDITSRVWMSTILADLKEHGILQCNDTSALERECERYGAHFGGDVAINIPPRPVIKSSLCGESLG